MNVQEFVALHLGEENTKTLAYHYASVCDQPLVESEPDDQGDILFSTEVADYRVTGWIFADNSAELSVSIRLSSGEHQALQTFR